VTTSVRDVGAALGEAIAQRIGEPRYNLWFGRNTKFTWDDHLLVVGVPNHFFQEWLDHTFADAVRTAACDVLERPMQVRFAIDAELFQAARRAQGTARPVEAERQALTSRRSGARESHEAPAEVVSAPARAAAVSPGRARPAAPQKRARHWRRLADFVVGPCNRVAHASAVSVVEAPGEGANPLVLYGPVGTGKTHLLEGTYAGLRKGHASLRIRYITAEEFTNRFLQALRLGKLPGFRNQFRELDVLLVDDLHFLAGKRASHEEFLHTFDALLAGGRQVVVTCDCHPKLADELAPELIDRLLGGAVWSLTPPDEETRVHLLRAKTGHAEVPLPEDVLRLMAGQLRGNVRELEGALHSVRHYSRVTGRPIDLALAREALGDLLRHAVQVVQLVDVDRAVCQVMRLEARALQSKQRAWAVSHPRMLAMHLARKHTAAAYSEIGQYFGGRNHSTAIAAEKKVRRWLQEDETLALGERRLRVREVVELVERALLR
jgi:chromosomal replication initiator protein